MRAGGIVEHVVLLGAPVSWHAKTLRMVRRVVAGRFVNCYSSVDWVLSLSFRCAAGTESGCVWFAALASRMPSRVCTLSQRACVRSQAQTRGGA